MAFVDVALLVGGAVGLEGTAAVVGGGALIGAGVGGGYSAITGDGNILNSMLTGAAIGGAGAYGIGSMGAGEAATQAAMAGPFFGAPTAAPVAAGVGGGGGAAGGAATGANTVTGAALANASADPILAASNLSGMTAADIASANIPAGSTAGLSGAKMLGYGLAGTTALQLLGNQNRPSAGGGSKEDEYDRRLKGYKLSPNYQPYQAPTPNPYYRPTYAAVGGIMNSNIPHSFDDETGSDNVGMAAGGFNMANGGMTSLGGYSDGGRMLKGPGDGMSDSIPGVIGGSQPARLADGEFVVPADVVSHLGNGSTDAGAKRLYSMMDNIRKARTGRKKQAPEVNVDKYLPVKKASGGIAGYAGGGAIRFVDGGDVTYNSQLAANVQAAYNQGYSGAQIGAALIASGVDQATAAAATGLDAGTIAQVYAGGAALTAGGGGIGSPAGSARNTAVTTTTTPVTSVTPATSAPVNINTTGPGGYTIPFFPPGAIASYIKTQGITTPAQFEQLKLIFNVNDAQIAAAQNLIKNNDPIVDATTAKYYADIKANPGQVAQNANDFAARAAQLGISTKDLLIKPTVEVPIKPIEKPIEPVVSPQSTTTTGPLAGSNVYRPTFVPRTSGVNMSDAIKDPYSNAGLESLYRQMMGQYEKPAAPKSDTQVRELVQKYIGNGAETGRQLINAGIPVNQTISALKSYPGITPEIVNQAYIGGESLGTAPPPTLNTQYNYSDPGTYYRPPSPSNLILTRPIIDAAFTPPVAPAAPATPAAPYVQGGDRAGGLMSINRKKHKRGK